MKTTPPAEAPIYVTTAAAAQLFSVSKETLKTWRLGDRRGGKPKLIKGVHWVNIRERKVLFNRELLADFVSNMHRPEHHERAVRRFLTALPSSQPTAAIHAGLDRSALAPGQTGTSPPPPPNKPTAAALLP